MTPSMELSEHSLELQVSDVWLYQLVSPHDTDSTRLTVVITVGESSSWVRELVDRASKLKVGSGFDPSTDVYVSFPQTNSN